MRRLLALTVLTLACGSALASNRGCDVNVESEYDLALNERSVILTRERGAPKAIVMRQGRMFVDDAWVSLSPADSRRIAAFEQSTRATMPEAQAIGRAAAEIAFTTLGELAAGLSNDPAAGNAKLAKARLQLDARLARSVTATRFDGADLGDGISQAIGEVLPSMIGDIVGGAISAAFSGDTSRLKRMENLDAQIEAKVKPRALALERRAEGLCRRMIELDGIDNAFEYRHDGKPLNLLQVEKGRADARHKD
ncbi:MAG: DUF2884 family protein [Lysobacter sp.]